jgi:sugar (pentulose or hexulose) kinase
MIRSFLVAIDAGHTVTKAVLFDVSARTGRYAGRLADEVLARTGQIGR